MGVKPLPTGIYGIIGAPGAGKSFKAVREIANRACKTPRPIYTNIPIVPKKLRAYIYCKLPKKVRGHAARRARANLVKPITQRHFTAFCLRLAKVDNTAEQIMDEWGLDAEGDGEMADFYQTKARNEAMARVAAEDGPPVIQGSEADWIPPGSILFLDELHKWFPSRNYKDEAAEILAFTSMHRHCQLMVFVLSQRWMNISLSFRSMATEVWYCMNWAKAPIMGFIRLSNWINVFRYVHYNGEDIEERTGAPRIGAKPVWSEMIWPELSGAPEFACYKSYSHAGTLEEQQAEIERVTMAMMGMSEDAIKKAEQQKETDMAKKQHLGKRINKGVTVAGFAGLAFMIGRCSAPPTEVIVEREATETAEDAEQFAEGEDVAVELVTQQGPTPAQEQQAETTTPPQPPTWADKRASGISRQGVMIEGRAYELGEAFGGDLLLVAVDAEIGSSIWISPDGGVYHWRVGRVPTAGVLPEPVRRRLVEELRGTTPGGEPADAPSPPGGVVAP